MMTCHANSMLSNLQEAVDLRRIQREVSILSRLSNSTIIRLLEVVETRTHIYLVMELAQVGGKEKTRQDSWNHEAGLPPPALRPGQELNGGAQPELAPPPTASACCRVAVKLDAVRRELDWGMDQLAHAAFASYTTPAISFPPPPCCAAGCTSARENAHRAGLGHPAAGTCCLLP